MIQAVTYTADNGVSYTDHKRSMWIVALLVPMLVLVGPTLYFATGNAVWLWFPIAFNYLVIPSLDLLMGEDTSNPPEEVVPLLEEDHYYRYVTYALIPVIWGAFLFSAWFVGTQALPWHGVLAMIIVMGGICGFGMNLGHELGHKRNPLERWLAKFVLALGGYGHFFIEHNKGHHRDVATPEDPASSRMGESLWKFLRREMPGAAKRAWHLEKERLQREGHSVWSLQNEIIQPAIVTIVLYASLIYAFGWIMVPFLAAVAFWGAFQLTCANYIEHYGLLRQKLDNGSYERPQPHHSWNSNHIFSNWATFHLQRHSDHHAYPLRRYQSLRHFDNLPSLPNGYFGMYLVAYFPAWWYAVMDRRLLEHVGHDASRINFDPERRDELVQKYGLRNA